uniref:Uncharacterized protein n=1 Tax=Romanomermis culicivorax TaxID=13658 RepID=A0A915HS80_ROMCU
MEIIPLIIYPRNKYVARIGFRNVQGKHVTNVSMEALYHLATFDVPNGTRGITASKRKIRSKKAAPRGEDNNNRAEETKQPPLDLLGIERVCRLIATLAVEGSLSCSLAVA